MLSNLAGAAFGFAYYKLNWNFSSLVGTVSTGIKRRRGPKLKIHDPDRKAEKLDEQADAVLDKLHRDGEESLSWSWLYRFLRYERDGESGKFWLSFFPVWSWGEG